MHSSTHSRLTPLARLAAGLGAGLLASVALAAPALATPALATPATTGALGALAGPVKAHEGHTTCEVTEATLTWGVKESFRSYISGAIANGEWTVSDDMRYETPSFIWDRATGDFAPELEEGEIGFTGAVHFTGHDGAMSLDIANPKIEFAADSTAYLVLDIGSSDTTSGGESVAQTSVRTAKIDLATAVTSSDTSLAIEGAVPRLTAEGAEALNGAYGSYVAGEELDPISLETTVAGCELGAKTAKEQPVEKPGEGLVEITPGTPVAPESPEIPWLPIGIGAVALLVIGVTGGMLLGGKGKGKGKNAGGGQAPTE